MLKNRMVTSDQKSNSKTIFTFQTAPDQVRVYFENYVIGVFDCAPEHQEALLSELRLLCDTKNFYDHHSLNAAVSRIKRFRPTPNTRMTRGG
jgi:hypothetical protein